MRNYAVNIGRSEDANTTFTAITTNVSATVTSSPKLYIDLATPELPELSGLPKSQEAEEAPGMPGALPMPPLPATPPVPTPYTGISGIAHQEPAIRHFLMEQSDRPSVAPPAAAHQGEMPCAPPTQRAAFDPAVHTITPIILQALLGVDAAQQVGDTWNIASRSGVADIQSRLGVDNVMFVAFCTPTSTRIYFAQEIEPHGGKAPRLHVQNQLRVANTMCDGPLIIVNARDRVNHVLSGQDRGSAFARNTRVIGTLPPQMQSAEATIARALELDGIASSITSRVHVVRLIDNAASSTEFLPTLRAVTHGAIDYVFLSDMSVRVDNSNFKTVREFQRMALVFHEIRNQIRAADSALLHENAPKLLDKDILTTLAQGLEHADTDSKATAKLSIQCATAYLQLLSALVDKAVLAPDANWRALVSPEGYRLTSMLGMRAGDHEALGDALIHVFDALTEKGVAFRSIKLLLIARERSEYRGFVKEMCRYRRSGRSPHAEPLRQKLIGRGYYARWTSKASSARKLAMFTRGLTFRRHDSLIPPSRITERSQTPERFLDRLYDALNLSALTEMALTVCRKDLDELMPCCTDRERREFRALLEKTVTDAWQKQLPGERPPSRIAEDLLRDAGPGYRQSASESRRPMVDDIKTNMLHAYGDFLLGRPDASRTEVEEKYARLRAAALSEYLALVQQDGSQTDERLQGSVDQGKALASTSAQALKAQRLATAAATAGVAKAAQSAARREAAEQSSGYARRAATEAANAAKLRAQRAVQTGLATTSSWMAKQALDKVSRDIQARCLRDATSKAIGLTMRESQEAAARQVQERARQASAVAAATASREAQNRATLEAQARAAIAAQQRANRDASRLAAERARDEAAGVRNAIPALSRQHSLPSGKFSARRKHAPAGYVPIVHSRRAITRSSPIVAPPCR